MLERKKKPREPGPFGHSVSFGGKRAEGFKKSVAICRAGGEVFRTPMNEKAGNIRPRASVGVTASAAKERAGSQAVLGLLGHCGLAQGGPCAHSLVAGASLAEEAKKGTLRGD